MNAEAIFNKLADNAGIHVDGDKPWDIQVHNSGLYGRVLRQGTLGLGESYMDGWWDCERLDEMVCRAMAATSAQLAIARNAHTRLHDLVMKFLNRQTLGRATRVAEQHYNGDHAMFQAMLDPYMQYSCGWWENASTLAEAQIAKMELICRKLCLAPGMNVLDIGCGWGGLARYMAERHGVRVTGVNISTEQLAYAKEHAGSLQVSYLEKDYRHLSGAWDRIVSVGMFEHVGPRNYREFFAKARQCLKRDGLLLLHTIGGNGGRDSGSDVWLEKYIFPNGILPSPMGITKAIEELFVLEDWHNFGADYDKTAMAWHRNFEEGYRQGAFKCTERQRRMFAYYLLSCAGCFRSRNIQLWQLVLSPGGVPGGYRRP